LLASPNCAGHAPPQHRQRQQNEEDTMPSSRPGRLLTACRPRWLALALSLPLLTSVWAAELRWPQLADSIDTQRRSADQARQHACTQRDDALRAWFRSTRDGEAGLTQQELSRLKGAHKEASELCMQEVTRARKLSALWDSLHDHYGSECPAVGPCPRRDIQTSLQALLPLRAAADDGKKDSVQAALLDAAGAQARVAKAKAEAEGAYAVGDKAASVGLEAAAQASPIAAGHEVSRARARDLAAQGERAREAAMRSERLKGQAQREANLLVEQALELAQCRAGGPCEEGVDTTLAKVQAASKRLENSVGSITEDFLAAKKLRWAQDTHDLSGDRLVRALRYLQLMDDNPDAKALVGEDAAFFSASNKGTEAVIRLSLKRTGIGFLRRSNLAFSAPLSDGEATLLERRADRMSARPNVRFTSNAVAVPTSGYLVASYGLTASAGRQTLSYVDPAKLGELSKLATKPVSLGLAGTLIWDERSAHSISVERQRTWDEGDATITCPLPASGASSVSCLSGQLGLPRQTLGTVSKYGYRRKVTLFGAPSGFAMNLEYDAATRLFDVSLPVYLIQNADKPGELNAGIRLGWGNKSRGNNIGIFVSTPFSLGGS
jgi:hypothetical protein